MTMTAIAPSATGTDTAAALKEVRKAEAYANTGRSGGSAADARPGVSLDPARSRQSPSLASCKIHRMVPRPEAETNCSRSC